MVVAQLAEWLLPTPEFHGTNTVIVEILKNIDLLSTAKHYAYRFVSNNRRRFIRLPTGFYSKWQCRFL